METKKCTKCKEIKKIEEFNNTKRNGDGKRFECRLCQKKYGISYSNRIKENSPNNIECKKCKTVKCFTEFHKNKYGRYGLSSWCKVCALSNLKNWTGLPFDPVSNVKLCVSCNENKVITEFTKSRNGSDGYGTKCKTCRRSEKFKIRYQITSEQYGFMLIDQQNKCAICAKDKSENRIHNRTKEAASLAVDHSHETGKIRGLLCCACNRAIGALYDNPMSAYNATIYLISNGFNKNIPKDRVYGLFMELKELLTNYVSETSNSAVGETSFNTDSL